MDDLERERVEARERALEFVEGWSGSLDGLLLFVAAVAGLVAERSGAVNAVKWRVISLVKEVEV